MSIVASYSPNTEQSTAPEGLWSATCVDVVDLGLRPTQHGEKHKVRIVWQIEEKDERGRRYTASAMYTLSLHPEASLSKMLEAWRGRKFTDEERAGFDLEVLIGIPCQIQIVQAPGKDGRIWGNVQACVPVAKGTVPIRPEGYTRQKDREQKNGHAGSEGPTKYDDDRTPF